MIGFGRSNPCLLTLGNEQSWATFSTDMRYRYVLARFWEDFYTEDLFERATSPLFVAGLLNPSTASHEEDDPTVRKLIHYAKRERCGGLLLVNAAALRSTDPKELVRASKRGEDIVGPWNERAVQWATRAPLLAVRVVAWGRMPSPRLDWLARRAWSDWSGLRPRVFGRNKDGTPKHPLYLRNDCPLVPAVMKETA